MRLLGCPPADIEWQDELLRRSGLGNAPRVEPPAVMRAMGADKKVHSGSVGWVLLERRGSPRFGQLVPEETARAVLHEMLA